MQLLQDLKVRTYPNHLSRPWHHPPDRLSKWLMPASERTHSAVLRMAWLVSNFQPHVGSGNKQIFGRQKNTTKKWNSKFRNWLCTLDVQIFFWTWYMETRKHCWIFVIHCLEIFAIVLAPSLARETAALWSPVCKKTQSKQHKAAPEISKCKKKHHKCCKQHSKWGKS